MAWVGTRTDSWVTSPRLTRSPGSSRGARVRAENPCDGMHLESAAQSRHPPEPESIESQMRGESRGRSLIGTGTVTTEFQPHPRRSKELISFTAMEVKVDVCQFCKGSGSCANCSGKDQRGTHKSWFRKRIRLCGTCNGSGKCNLCHGTGKRVAHS